MGNTPGSTAVPARPSSVERAMLVLEACAQASGASTIAEISRHTGISTSSVHRLCWKLVDLGALTHTRKGFTVGMRIIALGGSSPWLRYLRTEAAPTLHRLASETRLIGNLACLVGGEALLIDEVFSSESGVPKEVGRRLPLHASAIGKALLMHRPPAEVNQILGKQDSDQFSISTLADKAQLDDELVRANQQGFVISRGGWRSGRFGVGAPILSNGTTVASIALVGSLAISSLTGLGERVSEAAAQLSERFTSN